MSSPYGTPRDAYHPAIRSYPLPTVQIADGQGGFITINEADFDAATMTRYVAPSAESSTPAPSKAKGGKAKGAE